MPALGKYVMFPLEKNKIVVRFENIADKFDSDAAQFQYNVRDFAEAVYKVANPNADRLHNVHIQETSITHNMDIKTVEERRRKYQWKGEDDDVFDQFHAQVQASRLPDNGDLMTFAPQEIRTFIFTYHASIEEATAFIN
jgi:hypothetical protein